MVVNPTKDKFWILLAIPLLGFSASLEKSFSPIKGAQLGWSLLDIANDSVLDARDADKNFIPGSIQKLFTTWIALDLLGADKTFATELLYSGSLQGEMLQGDLIIKGGGDPTFGDVQFAEDRSQAVIFNSWLLALKKLGLRQVKGCVEGDGSYLIEEGPNPAMLWEDAGNYYAGNVSGLSFNANLYSLNFTGSPTPGKSVTLQNTQPMHTGIATFRNHLLTGSTTSKDSAFILGGFPSSVRELRGTYPAGPRSFSIKGSLPNPAWTCAREFHDFLTAHGLSILNGNRACGDSLTLPNRISVQSLVSVSEPVLVPVPESKCISPPLGQLIRHTNQKSDNTYAAQLLALIGKSKGPSGDWRGGLVVVNAYLAKLGFPLAEFHFKDGNGLSRYNWVSPRQVTHLLTYASHQKAFPEFRASLIGTDPQAKNHSDTHGPATDMAVKLGRYGNDWQGKLWIKTGTLEGVRSLSGYFQARSGRMLAFTLVVNNFEGNGNEMQKIFGSQLRNWADKY